MLSLKGVANFNSKIAPTNIEIIASNTKNTNHTGINNTMNNAKNTDKTNVMNAMDNMKNTNNMTNNIKIQIMLTHMTSSRRYRYFARAGEIKYRCCTLRDLFRRRVGATVRPKIRGHHKVFSSTPLGLQCTEC